MAIERTFSIIKPDATKRNLTGAINTKIEAAGLRIVAQKRVQWKLADAKKFYAVHAKRPFFKDLVKFMASGPIVVQVLEGNGAVKKYRNVMGATNPSEADAGTTAGGCFRAFQSHVWNDACRGDASPQHFRRGCRVGGSSSVDASFGSNSRAGALCHR